MWWPAMLPAPMMPTRIVSFWLMTLARVSCAKSHLQQPGCSFDMTRQVVAPNRPGHGLRQAPKAGTLSVEAELRRKPVQTVPDFAATDPELKRPHDGREPELSLPDERFGVDRQPRFTPRLQDVVAVQVLMQQDRLALRSGQAVQGVQGGVDEPLAERLARPLPRLAQLGSPPRSLVRQGAEGRSLGGLPEAWEKGCQ